MVLEGQSFVIETEEMEHGGMQVIDVDFAIDGVVAEVVGCSMNNAAFDAAAGHPHREPVLVMLATVAVLGVRSAPKFAAPQNQRLV